MVNKMGSGMTIPGGVGGGETLASDFESPKPIKDRMLAGGGNGNVNENGDSEEKRNDKMNSMEFERGEDDAFDLSREHGKALADYIDGGFKETGRYVERLVEILRIKRGNDGTEMRAPHESEGVGGNGQEIGNNDLPVLRAPLPPSTVNLMSLVVSFQEADTAEVSMILFNLSAALFQMDRLREAREVLEHLFLHIEPLDDHVAVAVCCLLLDVLCSSVRGRILGRAGKQRYKRQTDAILAFLEMPHTLNPSVPCISNSMPGGHEEGGGGTTSHHHSAARDRDQAEFIFRLHLYKAKVLLLQHESKQCKKEVKGALEIFQRELRELEQQNDEDRQNPSIKDCRRWKAFGRLPNPGIQNMAALYAKANLEYQRNNPKKALKLLASCHGIQGSDEYVGPGEPVGPLYYNNMGCLHHKLGKHHVALHYFQKSLQEQGNSPGMEDGRRQQDGHLSGNIYCEILYNTGLQLQQTGRPVSALRCFDQASLQFCDRPLLWLRMAECCLSIHSSYGGGGVKESGREKFQELNGGENTLRGTLVGKGVRRRALLHPAGSASERQSIQAMEILVRAERYLQNAFYLCSSSLSSDALQDGNINDPIAYRELGSAKDGQRTPEYTSYSSSDVPSHHDTDLKLLQRVHLNLSYVYLSLSNPVSALHHAQKSLNLEFGDDNSLNGRLLTLSRSYAAEAQVMMNRPHEALTELSAIQDAINKGKNLTKTGEEDVTLTGSVLLNMAATQTFLGNYSEAQHLLQAAMHYSGGYSSSKASHMLVYILLKTNHPIEAAKALNLI